MNVCDFHFHKNTSFSPEQKDGSQSFIRIFVYALATAATTNIRSHLVKIGNVRSESKLGEWEEAYVDETNRLNEKPKLVSHFCIFIYRVSN